MPKYCDLTTHCTGRTKSTLSRLRRRDISSAPRMKCLLLLLSWTAVPWPAFSQGASTQPELPALSVNVVPTVKGIQVNGHVSDSRSSQDGRVRLDGSGGGPRIFFTSRPEIFSQGIHEERLSSDGREMEINSSLFHASAIKGARTGHVSICDPYLAGDLNNNPYACTYKGRPADCYDLGVLAVVHIPDSSTPGGVRSELWSTQVTTTVRQPKTSRAQVVRVQFRGKPARSPIKTSPSKAGQILLEPVISGDGKLLFLNAQGDLVYSVIAAGEVPCDARNWRRLDPISKMHQDPKMERYGVATHPIRDSENKRVKPGRAVHGAYPWIDRAGNNLFFTQVGGLGLFYRNALGKLRTRFPIVNPPKQRDIIFENPTRFAMSYLGLWSQGKIIIPDTRINNSDYHLGAKSYQPIVELYSDQPEGVRLDRATLVGINSPESQWNYISSLLPRSPRDVVWWLSGSNGMTDEVIFDDALDSGTLIFSPMNAAVDNKKRNWRDGFDYKKMKGYVKTPRLQNAAASTLQWNLPKFGRVLGGRVEPIAAGGVRGKGFWLSANQGGLSYSIPQQAGSAETAMTNTTWTTTIWVDPRRQQRGRLISFPDGSWIDMESGDLIWGSTSTTEAALAVPSNLRLVNGQWNHLAVVSTPGWTDFYLHGFKLASVQGAYFRIQPGALRLGRPASGEIEGIQGWVDELRVVSGEKNPEVLCNYAHGTLRGVDQDSSNSDFSLAASYPQTSHDEISARLSSTARRSFDRYRCEQERDQSHRCLTQIHQPLSTDLTCVRSALLFPEGPLFHDQPRPDSQGNLFCLSCHSADQSRPSLQVKAPLQADPRWRELATDPRRQPSQAPRRLHGFIPKELFALPEDVTAPLEGILLDPLLYPSTLGSNAAGIH